jgi:group II intron reverse transcriptase/maturase
MQKAEVVLEVLRERGRKGLPCDELYRQMFNRDLYLMAYGNVYSNQGAMTPGTDGGTADGMSMAIADHIIGEMRAERYRFHPARRVYIPKKNGKLRPLGLPTWADKLVGEVVRLLLEAYYEPRFSRNSHAYRPGKGCHTALRSVQDSWTGTAWFVEGDISGCFDNIDHQRLLRIISGKITDQRFLRLIGNMLKAGYLEDWTFHETLSGTPQGGVTSPVLCNIYLHELDNYIEKEIIPRHTRGDRRKPNPAWSALASQRRKSRRHGERSEARETLRQMRRVPSADPADPGYRRLHYCRYADDVLLGFIGPKAEAEQIKAEIGQFLRENLALELNPAKTLITHARSQCARFLGYEITVQHENTKITKSKKQPNGRRAANGKIALRVPRDVIKVKCALYRKRGKPWPRTRLQNLDDYEIVRIYGAEFRGIVNYYLLAQNVSALAALQWTAQTSMLRTLAAKHKSSVAKMAEKHRAKIDTVHGTRTCYEARKTREGKPDLVSRFGGIPLKRDRKAEIRDPKAKPAIPAPKEITYRIQKNWCEMCEQSTTVEAHQVTRLADLGEKGPGQPPWAALMMKKRRKALIVCPACHEHIHTHPVTLAA